MCELAHLRLAGGEAQFDDEIRTRSNQRLFERRDESAQFDEIADQRLTAERVLDRQGLSLVTALGEPALLVVQPGSVIARRPLRRAA